MASLGDIVIALTMDNRQFTGAAEQTRGQLAGIGTVATSVAGQIAGLLGVGTAIAAIGFGVKLAADAEQTQIAFEVMLGSASKAKSMLADLKTYADKSPFGSADTNQFAQMLLNYGIAGEKILPTIRMLGDVAAGDKQKFEGLARAFGQMSATGRLMGGDLNQFINAGFNPLQEIAAKTGESMAALKKRMEDGGVSSDEVAAAFQRATSAGGRFYQMTERQSQTLSGQWSTFRDTLDTTLRDIGASIAENLDLKGIIQSSGQWLQWGGQIVKNYGRELVMLSSVFTALVGGIALARGALMAYSAMQSVLIVKELTLKALLGPTAWAQVAIGLTAAAATGLYLSGVFGKASEEAKKTADGIGEIKKQADGLSGSASGASSQLQSLIALQVRMQQLQNVKSHSPQLAQKLAVGEFQAADLSKLLGLDQVAEQADKANPRVQLLRETLASLNSMDGLVPAAQITAMADKINAAIVREINDRSGLTTAIAKQTEELKKLEMGEAAYAAAKMKEKGASEDGLQQLAQINARTDAVKLLKAAEEELAKMKAGSEDQYKLNKVKESFDQTGQADRSILDKIEQTQQLTQAMKDQKKAAEELAEKEKRDAEQLQAKAKQLTEQTMTALEKRQKKVSEINDLASRGLIDEETKRRGIKDADEEYAKATKEKGPKSNAGRAAMAGSSEAVAIMLRGVFNPDKAQLNVSKQLLAEAKETKKLMAQQKSSKQTVVNING